MRTLDRKEAFKTGTGANAVFLPDQGLIVSFARLIDVAAECGMRDAGAANDQRRKLKVGMSASSPTHPQKRNEWGTRARLLLSSN
jgi:hypothetical protein